MISVFFLDLEVYGLLTMRESTVEVGGRVEYGIMIMIMIVRTLLRQFRGKRHAISDAGERLPIYCNDLDLESHQSTIRANHSAFAGYENGLN